MECEKQASHYVHIYVAKTDALEAKETFARYYDKVSPQRREKIDRLRLPADRVRSLAVELLLQHALAERGITQYTIRCGEHGKPYLADHPEVYFNLSHAGKVVMCVVSDSEVGCDVEEIVEGREALAQRFFTPREAAEIAAQPTGEAKIALFYRYWTLKESFMKVTGRGMSLSPTAFEFELQADKIFIRHTVDDGTYEAREYDLLDGYRFAVCARSAAFFEPQWVNLTSDI